MGSFFDFNDADGQREKGELIPSGALVKLMMKIRPGGERESQGWLTESKNGSDAVYIDGEFTVVTGEFMGRKLWSNMTVAGGKTNDKGDSIGGNISRSTIRAMLESARNILPADMSEAASSKRRIAGFGDLDGIEFAAKIGIEKAKPNTNYPDKNIIAVVITPDRPEYAAVMAGTYTAPIPATAPATGATVDAGWKGAPAQTAAAPKGNGWAASGAPNQAAPSSAANGNGSKINKPNWA